MHAIIVTGGKQYKVAEGDTLFIEKLPAEADSQVVFDEVLAILDGDNATIGTPTVAGVFGPPSALYQGRDQEDQRLRDDDRHVLYGGEPDHRL